MTNKSLEAFTDGAAYGTALAWLVAGLPCAIAMIWRGLTVGDIWAWIAATIYFIGWLVSIPTYKSTKAHYDYNQRIRRERLKELDRQGIGKKYSWD